MKRHILIEKAYCYPDPRESRVPNNCTFIQKSGYWRNNSTGEIMMLSNDSCFPQTKKEDVETGEDQKGE
jgi:hypothetical protein